MGAFVAPLVCARVDVALLVLVCPMIPLPGESPGEWWSASGSGAARREQDAREGRDPDAEFDPIAAFFHDVPRETIAAALERGEPRQSDTPFERPWPVDAWPDVPTRVLAGRNDRLFPLDFQRRLARERLDLDVDVIDSGHLPALARPEELVELLERCRTETEDDGAMMLELTRVVSAARPAVFELFTDPDLLAQWWGPRGFSVPRPDWDPRVGASYRIEMQPPGGDPFHLVGEFRDVEPPARLAFTFVWEPADPDDVETLATLSFADARDSTEVTLEQGPFKTEERVELHRGGWRESFDKLEELVAARR
jgi:uncharacterized protein YndB with AHSA1/START domain